MEYRNFSAAFCRIPLSTLFLSVLMALPFAVSIEGQKRRASPSTKNASGVQTSPVNLKNATCDTLAAHPEDKKRLGAGIADERIVAGAAIEKCTLAVEENPDEARFHFQLGRAYWKARRYDEALEAFLKAEEMNYAPAVFYLGQAYEKGFISGEKADPAAAKNLYLIAASEGFEPAIRAYQELAGNEPDFSEFKQPRLMKALYDGDLEAFNQNRVDAVAYAVGVENFITIPDSEYDPTCKGLIDTATNDKLRKMLYMNIFGLPAEAVNWSDERVGAATLPKFFDPRFNMMLARYQKVKDDGTNDLYLLSYDYGTCKGAIVKKVYSTVKRFVNEKYLR